MQSGVSYHWKHFSIAPYFRRAHLPKYREEAINHTPHWLPEKERPSIRQTVSIFFSAALHC